MAHIIGQSKQTITRPRDATGHRLAIPLACTVALAFVALGYVVYVLWPRWPEPPVAADAPPLPIIVSGVGIQRAACRYSHRRPTPARHTRAQSFVYLWPSLAPPETEAKSAKFLRAQVTASS